MPQFKSFNDAIEETLLYMECATWQPADPRLYAGDSILIALPLTYWNGAEVALDPDLMPEGSRRSLKVLDPANPLVHEWIQRIPTWDMRHLHFVDDISHAEVKAELQAQGRYTPSMDRLSASAGTYFTMGRFRYVSRRRVRQYILPGFHTVGERADAIVRTDGSYDTARWYVGYDPDRQAWRNITCNSHPALLCEPRMWELDSPLLSTMAIDAFLRWRVTFGLGEGPRVGFVTDAIGAQESFRFRDLPQGRSRRTALRHWVKEHWRQLRREPIFETQVRQHLRGDTHFTWHGLTCDLYVSPEDTLWAEQHERGREKARVMGIDRRLVAEGGY